MYSDAAPINMLIRPIMRILRLSISASLRTVAFQRFGYKNGMIPSMINIKQNAVIRSCHMRNAFPRRVDSGASKNVRVVYSLESITHDDPLPRTKRGRFYLFLKHKKSAVSRQDTALWFKASG
jgi:hypothetical protein